MTLKKREFTPESGSVDTYAIFIKLVLMDRQFDKDSKYVIFVQIGEYLGALTL